MVPITMNNATLSYWQAWYYAHGRNDQMAQDNRDDTIAEYRVFTNPELDYFAEAYAGQGETRQSVQGFWRTMRHVRLVKVDRVDGSRTWKGPMPHLCALREKDAWDALDTVATVELIDVRDRELTDFDTWQDATITGARYFPPAEEAP